MLDFNDIRKGVIVVLEGEPCLVLSSQFLRKQKTRPVRRTKLRLLRTGATKEHTFKQSDQVEAADVERFPAQFLYAAGEELHFMNEATYEQFTVDAQLVAASDLLLEGQSVTVATFEGAPITVELPIKIEREVIDAPPGVKGDTSGNAMKDATVEGGVTIKVPLFVNTGDRIRIDTRDKSYEERL